MWIKNAARQVTNSPRLKSQSSLVAVLAALTFFTPTALAQLRPTQSFTYDASGNLTGSTNALGHSTQFTWDALGRPRLTTQPAPASGQPNPTIRTDFNSAGFLTRVTDPRSLATTYTSTGLGDVTSLVSPDTGSTTSTYDAAGNLKTRKDARGRTTTYTYDALNRLIQALYADGTSTALFYDESGAVEQLTRIVDPGVTSTFTYDLHGRVLTRTQTVLNGTTPLTHTLTHSYTPGSGKRRQSVYPSGRVLTLDYHPSTKVLQTVSFDGVVVAGAVQWHALSALPKSMRLANGQTWTSTMDLEGRLQSYTLGGSTWTLSWDAAHRLTQISNGDPTQAQSFAYDGLDRMTSFTSNPRDQSFTYDTSGNLTSKFDRVGSNPGQTDSFTIAANSNRMTQIANLAIGYGYDAAGNRTTTPTTTHTYNAKGRLIKSVVVSGGSTTTSN